MENVDFRFLTVRESGALSILQFHASVTAPTTAIEDVQDELNRFAGHSECQKLVIDLSAMSYLPSRLIGILVALSTRGIEVHMANASNDVADLMKVMGLNKRIQINKFELAAGDVLESKSKATSIPVAVVEGYFVSCSNCESVQEVNKHSIGSSIACRSCEGTVHVDAELIRRAAHMYCTCPHCEQQLRLTPDWIDATVTCEFCDRQLRVQRIR